MALTGSHADGVEDGLRDVDVLIRRPYAVDVVGRVSRGRRRREYDPHDESHDHQDERKHVTGHPAVSQLVLSFNSTAVKLTLSSYPALSCVVRCYVLRSATSVPLRHPCH